MSKTPFSQGNKKFTDDCHKLAQKILYPKMFGVSPECIEYENSNLGESARATMLDGEMAIDRIAKIHTDFLNRPIEVIIQERFRKPRFSKYRDLTITEWNNITDLPSELYKIKSGIFVYGYANNKKNPTDFIEVITADVVVTMIGIVSKKMEYQRGNNPRSDQDFITIKFDDLFNYGAIVHHYSSNGRQMNYKFKI